MDSKEFGLVAAQQLLQVEDLHYGFWEQGKSPSLGNFKQAQEDHTAFLFKHIGAATKDGRILDVGCGVGNTTRKLLEQGYSVDGLVPSAWMAQRARKQTEPYRARDKGTIYECKLEDFPSATLNSPYALAFFSESFQYVNMQKAFDMLRRILVAKGKIIIFDFFRKDGVQGKSPLGGGHSLQNFYEIVNKNNFTIVLDSDVTENLSPNLDIFNELLVKRVIPFGQSLDQFLSSRSKLMYTVVKYLARKRLQKLQYKYSTNRNAENFKKFKTYRLIVLQLS